MAPRGRGLAGPRLLSILSSFGSDGPFSIIDRILSWKRATGDHQRAHIIQTGFYRHLEVRKYSEVATAQHPNMRRIYDCKKKKKNNVVSLTR